MAELSNIMVVSDLHFGEELLPGATAERRHAVELGARAFREMLQYHRSRRLDGRPWRLVIAGDLFDFMSVVVPSTAGLPAKTMDERRYGLRRTAAAGVVRMRRICENHQVLLADMVKFAAAGHSIDIIVGNHDIELLEPAVVAELQRQLELAAEQPDIGRATPASVSGTPSHDPANTAAAEASSTPADASTVRVTPRGGIPAVGSPQLAAALARIRVVPWFVYVPGVAWIEHGHVYDEGCSFQYNLCPADPRTGVLIDNADFAATRYLAMTVPEIDPHGIEQWSFWGFIRYGWESGARSLGALWAGYARFAWALMRASAQHRSYKGSELRRRAHREKLRQVAAEGGISLDAATAIDRLARTPMTVGWRRLVRMLMLDRFGIALGLVVTIALLFLLLPTLPALIGAGAAAVGAASLHVWLGNHMVLSQLPMRAVPLRIRKHVDAPVFVFGHTHDPRWQPLRSGGLYVNAGTWLPALRPGLRRSFTHVRIQPRPGSTPHVELRQWRDGTSQPFDAWADLGAGVTAPGMMDATDWTKAI